LAVFEIFEEEPLLERANVIGATMMARMRAWQQRWPFIGDVRGRGAMVAMEIVKDPQSKIPDPELTSRITRKAWENGAIILQAGTDGNVLRFPMPLVMTDEQLQRGLDILEKSIGEAATERGA